MPSPTPNLGLPKPAVDSESWDGDYYSAMDLLDAHPGTAMADGESSRPPAPFEGQVISRLDVPGLLEQYLNGEWHPVQSSVIQPVTFQQDVPQAVWTITHNLGYFPSVTVFDSSGAEVEGEEHHIDNNTVQVIFAAAFGGSAHLI